MLCSWAVKPRAPCFHSHPLQVLAVPPLRPLCLVVKAFLREHGMNEVFTGGVVCAGLGRLSCQL